MPNLTLKRRCVLPPSFVWDWLSLHPLGMVEKVGEIEHIIHGVSGMCLPLLTLRILAQALLQSTVLLIRILYKK